VAVGGVDEAAVEEDDRILRIKRDGFGQVSERRIKVAFGFVNEAAVEESGGIFRVELD